VTLPFLTCPRCIWEINQARSTSCHGPASPRITSAQAAVGASSGTYMGGLAAGNFIDSYPLVQLAAYPEYDGKDDQDRERHGDAGA
jgi:hypothetical protein